MLNSLANKTHLCLAPMQGITNVYFRTILEQIGGMDALYTEFFNPTSVHRRSKRIQEELLQSRHGIPLVVQLIGSNPQQLQVAGKSLLELGLSHLNLNAGCPYGRLARRLAGGRLMKHPEILGEIIDRVAELQPDSFSVKIRAGYDTLEDLPPILEKLKHPAVSFIILHSRLVTDGYRKNADHSLIPQVRSILPEKPLILNGDVISPSKALTLLEETGAHGIMIGRGAMQNPWLFRQIRSLMNPQSPSFKKITPEDFWNLYTSFRDCFAKRLHPPERMLNPLKEIFGHTAKLLDHSGDLSHNLLRSNNLEHFEEQLLNCIGQKESVPLPI